MSAIPGLMEVVAQTLIQRVDKLRPADGDVVVVQVSEELTGPGGEYLKERLAAALLDRGHQNTMIVLLHPGMEIRTLDEAEMRRHGWVRESTLTDAARCMRDWAGILESWLAAPGGMPAPSIRTLAIRMRQQADRLEPGNC